jgi:hypothetical protein
MITCDTLANNVRLFLYVGRQPLCAYNPPANPRRQRVFSESPGRKVQHRRDPVGVPLALPGV